MVDTYGGLAAHGGGAFSGKDATKVDRSGAYMARVIARNIVGAWLADRCQVVISYAIGKAEPTAVEIETFGTEKVDVDIIHKAVMEFSTCVPLQSFLCCTCAVPTSPRPLPMATSTVIKALGRM